MDISSASLAFQALLHAPSALSPPSHRSPQLPLQPLQPVRERPAAPSLEQLHPGLWRAHQLGRPQGAQAGVLASGHPLLDAQLPGGGWPAGTLTELLLPHPGVGELRLLAPALAALQRQQRSLMWFDPPAAPCPWALGALGIDVQRLVVVHSRVAAAPCLAAGGARLTRLAAGGSQVTRLAAGGSQVTRLAAGGAQVTRSEAGGAQVTRLAAGGAQPPRPAADVLWALEQALKSGHLGGVLAWLPPQLPPDALRRLQLAAQAHDGPVFLLRDAQQRSRPSPAPLRLLLSSASPDQLRVGLLKRRGPPLAQPLLLALPAVLSGPAYARAQAAAAQLAVAAAGPPPAVPSAPSASAWAP